MAGESISTLWHSGDMGWLIGALIVGTAALAVAFALDRRAERRAEQPPETGDARLDQHRPTYVTAAEIARLEPPTEADPTPGVGYAINSATLWANPAVLAGARVVVVDGPVTKERELYPIHALREPVLLVAEQHSGEVSDAVTANAKALRRMLLVVSASAEVRAAIASATGANPLRPSDLQAGFVPDEWLGRAASVTARSGTVEISPD